MECEIVSTAGRGAKQFEQGIKVPGPFDLESVRVAFTAALDIIDRSKGELTQVL